MTDKEAIEVLTSNVVENPELMYEALDLAIKALEKQPCGEENPNCTECRYYDHENHHCPRFCQVIEDTMAEITSQQTRWIPVSERLPEEDGVYLATCDGEICGENEPFTGLAEYENGKWVDDEEDYQCVLAWMPLPQPYAESEDDECKGCYYNDGEVHAECVICDKAESEDKE